FNKSCVKPIQIACRCLGVILVSRRASSFTLANKEVFYQNCEIFNNSDIYDGPICGNNGITYANSIYLNCLNYQMFQNVVPVHSGDCLPMDDYCKINLFYRPVCGSDGHTYTNLESLLCVNYKYSRDIMVVSNGACNIIDQCYGQETIMYAFNPVCANNGFTYQNAAQVKCLQRLNTNLRILHNGGCSVTEVYSIYNRIEKVCDIANSRYEWNPVCASDGVTYPNPFEFLCYQADSRSLVSDDECGKSTQVSCADLTTSVSANETITPEDEVCGSDGVTYRSIHHLQCYNNLTLKRSGACIEPEDDPCMSIPEEDLRLPVCGNDNLSYVSPEALWCAKSKFPDR
ncbi:unnamed protein product, partial [Heterotrigona itama]